MVTQPEASTEAVEPKGLWPEAALGVAGAPLLSGSDWHPVTSRVKAEERERASGASFIVGCESIGGGWRARVRVFDGLGIEGEQDGVQLLFEAFLRDSLATSVRQKWQPKRSPYSVNNR